MQPSNRALWGHKLYNASSHLKPFSSSLQCWCRGARTCETLPAPRPRARGGGWAEPSSRSGTLAWHGRCGRPGPGRGRAGAGQRLSLRGASSVCVARAPARALPGRPRRCSPHPLAGEGGVEEENRAPGAPALTGQCHIVLLVLTLKCM